MHPLADFPAVFFSSHFSLWYLSIYYLGAPPPWHCGSSSNTSRASTEAWLSTSTPANSYPAPRRRWRPFFFSASIYICSGIISGMISGVIQVATFASRSLPAGPAGAWEGREKVKSKSFSSANSGPATLVSSSSPSIWSRRMPASSRSTSTSPSSRRCGEIRHRFEDLLC